MNIKVNRTGSRRITRRELMYILCENPYSEENKLDLSCIDLSNEDLSNLMLSNIIFRNANLSNTVIKYSVLNGSDLSGANLSNAVFIGSHLKSVNLRKSNLRGAVFCSTDISSALIDTNTIDKYFPSICPSEGEFIGWKKAVIMEDAVTFHRVIVKLLIPKDARRSSAFGRKCRCDKAKVLSIETLDGLETNMDTAFSAYNGVFAYEIGKEVSVDNFDEDRSHECAPGIHFFMTREEAVEYPKSTYSNVAIYRP